MITVTEKLMMTIFMKMTIISIKMIFPMKKILLENSRKIEVTRYLFYGKLSKRKCNKKHGTKVHIAIMDLAAATAEPNGKKSNHK